MVLCIGRNHCHRSSSLPTQMVQPLKLSKWSVACFYPSGESFYLSSGLHLTRWSMLLGLGIISCLRIFSLLQFHQSLQSAAITAIRHPSFLGKEGPYPSCRGCCWARLAWIRVHWFLPCYASLSGQLVSVLCMHWCSLRFPSHSRFSHVFMCSCNFHHYL